MANSPNRQSRFWQELRRRKVLPFLIAYITACVAIIGLSSDVSETFSISKETVKLIYLLLAIGIPIVILLPWFINRKQSTVETDDSDEKKYPFLSDIPKRQDNSIIVLPFENISSDPDQEYFSDGLTEEIITDLSYIKDLLVISRSSAMTFKGSKKTLKEVTDAVNVRYALEGSVRKAGNSIRIVAQLIDGTDDSHIWAEKYNGTLDDIFTIQENVARSIADTLKIKLGSSELHKMYEDKIDNKEIYDIYIKAQIAFKTMTKAGINQALKYINHGLETIGDNDKLYALMGSMYLTLIEMGFTREKSIFKKIEDCSEKVFSLNPDSPDGHYLRGHVRRWHGDVTGSIQSYNKALAINPNHLWANFYRSWNYAFSGHGEIAKESIARILKTDPLNPISHMMAGAVETMKGNFNHGQDFMTKAFEMDPNPFFGWWLLKTMAYGNKLDEAFKLIEQFSDMADDVHWAKLGIIFRSAIEGEEEKVLESYTDELKNMLRGDELYGVWVAETYALIDHKQEALKWLEESINNQLLNYPFLTEHNVFLENLYKEEGYIKLMEQIKPKWIDFQV
jgi:TolB-like protein/tetratricopeptide (TPR) repeat protein